ncbi:autotransporter-associated beta strand repeat-containing protein [Rhodospirillales bacterium URHD0017]|nr:autotransporter-associated beta strand repeat-containing protein [Rhodospirillales bacterium URHD0017]
MKLNGDAFRQLWKPLRLRQLPGGSHLSQTPSQWENPTTNTPSILQLQFGPWGEDIPGDGLEYCGPTATLMAIYYLYNNNFTQLAPAAYGGEDDKNATNLELVLGGLMQTSSSGGTTAGMQPGVWAYLAACGISGNPKSLASSSKPDLAWFTSQLGPNVESDPDVIVLANFSVGWFQQQGTSSTYKRTGGHFLTPLVVPGSDNQLVLNNPAPSTFVKGARSALDNPQTVTVSPIPADITLLNQEGHTISDPTSYSQVITAILGPDSGTGMLAVITGGSAWSIPATDLPTDGWQPAPWQLSADQTINTNGGNLTVRSQLQGSFSLTKSGPGTLTLQQASQLTEPTTVSGGYLGSQQTDGTPFGSTSMIVSTGGVLQFSPSGSATIASAENAASFTAGGGAATLQLAGTNSFKVTIGGYNDSSTPNIQREPGGTLLIAPGSGVEAFGWQSDAQQVFVAGKKANLPVVLSSGMVAPWLLGVNNDAASSASFLTYDSSSGFQLPTATSSIAVIIADAKSDMIYQVVNLQTLDAGAIQVAALQMNLGGIYGQGTLLVGSQQSGDVAGVILNCALLGISTLAFGEAEAVIYTSGIIGAGTVTSVIKGLGGLTVCGPGWLTLLGNSASTLSGTINVNSGGLGAAGPGATGSADISVNAGSTLLVAAAVPGTVTVQQYGTLYLAGGTVAGALTIESIGSTSDLPGGTLQGYGTVSGTATIGGIIQCGPTVGLITFSGDATISNESAFYWQLQSPCDNGTSTPGTGWNALQFLTPGSSIGADGAVRIFLDFSVIGGDPDSGINPTFWESDLTWTIATFPSGATPNCSMTHGNFIYTSGAFCVCVTGNVVNLMWKPGETEWNWCYATGTARGSVRPQESCSAMRRAADGV